MTNLIPRGERAVNKGSIIHVSILSFDNKFTWREITSGDEMVEPGSLHLRFGHLGVTLEFEIFIINSNKNSEYLRVRNQYESDYSEQPHGGDCWLVNFW